MADQHIFIEHWTFKHAWHELTPRARQDYADQIKLASAGGHPSGVRVIAWGLVDRHAPQSIAHDFWAVWQADSAEAVRAFMAGVEASGWYRYFDQVNTVGRCSSASEVLSAMVALADKEG